MQPYVCDVNGTLMGKINASYFMNKILILGGSSDIGSELINHLIKTEKYLIHIHYNSNKPKIRNNNIKYIKINLQNLTNLKKK